MSTGEYGIDMAAAEQRIADYLRVHAGADGAVSLDLAAVASHRLHLEGLLKAAVDFEYVVVDRVSTVYPAPYHRLDVERSRHGTQWAILDYCCRQYWQPDPGGPHWTARLPDRAPKLSARFDTLQLALDQLPAAAWTLGGTPVPAADWKEPDHR